jgi:undecaprenyl-diphosphatase
MSQRTAEPPGRGLVPLAAMIAAAAVFTILLILVRLRWPPLESVDHGAASRLNRVIASHSVVVTTVKAVTRLGSDGVLWTVIAAAVIFLALRRRLQLAIYLLVTGAGALVLDPVLKSLVGRLRPVVAHPIAHGPGNSFPSGHALGSMVCYGALFLVFLPAARGRWRTVLTTVVVALVALIGISRLLLGVHYVSDVVGAWGIGIIWLGITAFAFELTRHSAGLPVTHPASEGLEPEADADLRPAQPEPAAGDSPSRHRGRIAAGILVAWVLILGVVVGVGELVVKYGGGNVLGDRTTPHWFAAHRTPTWNRWSLIVTTVGTTTAILIVSLAACVVFLAVTRHWRPVLYIAILMCGELAAFLAAGAVVKRVRPDVTHLDRHLPPTSAYPSGHEAATCCLYIAVAILVIGHARGWWRWLLLIPAIAMPTLVAISRLYRGEHHPTDIIGSLLLSALWLTAASILIKPNADGSHRAGDTVIPHSNSTTTRPAPRLAARPRSRMLCRALCGRPAPSPWPVGGILRGSWAARAPSAPWRFPLFLRVSAGERADIDWAVTSLGLPRWHAEARQ